MKELGVVMSLIIEHNAIEVHLRHISMCFSRYSVYVYVSQFVTIKNEWRKNRLCIKKICKK